MLYPVGLLSSRAIPVPRNGLVGEWLFSGNANDTSGSGYNGTVNGATLTTGRKGGSNEAYNFNGTDNISMGDVLDMGTNSFSLSLWANPTATTGLYTLVSKTDNAGSASSYFFGTDPTGKMRSFIRGTAGGILINLESVITTGWKHYVCLFDKSGNMRMYIDNVLQSVGTNITSISGQNMNNAFDFRLGQISSGAGGFFGTMDDVRVYNRILTTDEITALYNE